MWTTPKTDWIATDYYNVSDYERIRDNILWLKDLADNVVDANTVITKTYTYSVPDLTEMADKDYSDITFASVLNAIEDNFATINTNTHNIEDTRNTFEGNSAFYIYSLLNDIEEKIVTLHDYLLSDMVSMRKTQFTLSNDISQKGVRL